MKKLFYGLSILLIISKSLHSSNDTHAQIHSLATEIVDKSKNPDKSFASYMDDLIRILKPCDQAKVFCQKMETLKHSKNGNIVGVTFIQYRKLFSDDLIKWAVSMGKERLMEIFKFRTTIRQVVR